MSKMVGMGANTPKKDELAELQAIIDKMGVAGNELLADNKALQSRIDKLTEENKSLKAENAKLLKDTKKE